MNIEINTETKTIIIKQPIKISVLIDELKQLRIPLDEYSIQTMEYTFTYPLGIGDAGYVGDLDLHGTPMPYAGHPTVISKTEK
jgi:hypothetical protein